ncbi:MAG: hypothetical protein BWY45_03424 [Euryarchaeota archaeon ADurb.Bin294]|nr:MAG: hypothetical protein BWY45_03424 [Euryarchaeota archaeon ADurb.Bin294]
MDDIITNRADMVPGTDRFLNKIPPILLFQVLIHDNSIIARWNHITSAHLDNVR